MEEVIQEVTLSADRVQELISARSKLEVDATRRHNKMVKLGKLVPEIRAAVLAMNTALDTHMEDYPIAGGEIRLEVNKFSRAIEEVMKYHKQVAEEEYEKFSKDTRTITLILGGGKDAD